MNNDHAKIVLSVYRPHGQDANDPFFSEALQQAKLDPSLSAWLNDEQRWDEGIPHLCTTYTLRALKAIARNLPP